MNQIFLKKTNELTKDEVKQICILFHEVFPKHVMTASLCTKSFGIFYSCFVKRRK